MGKNENTMNFVGKILTDRDMFGNSMNLAKIIENSKVNKKDKADFVVFVDDIKALHNVAFGIFCDRMLTAKNADSANALNEYNDIEAERVKMFDAINAIFDDIGTIGQGKMIGHSVVYSHAIEHCFKYYDEYHGKALTVKSQLTNEKKTLKEYLDSPNGVNVEAIANAQNKVAKLEKELSELKKKPGMVTLEWRQSNANSFVADMEKFLCKLAKNQLPMSAEEYKNAKKSAKNEQNEKRKNAKK